MKEPPIPSGRECCLFLDIDGTLLDIAPTPDDVRVSGPMRALLRSLEFVCGGALALIGGRTIANIDDLFEPLFLPAAGVHGCERRDALGYWRRQSRGSPGFAIYRERACAAAAELEGVIVEDKESGLSLHYRLVPHMRAPLRQLLGNNVESEWRLENREAVRRWLASFASAREAA